MLFTEISPPISFAKYFDRYKPIPKPLKPVLFPEMDSFENFSKIQFNLSSGMPIPVSLTEIFKVGSVTHVISIVPESVNFTAFANRLRIILLSLNLSALIF